MITFKCKMCGGDLEFEQGATVVECPYCGSRQTLPKLDNDKRANMYDRANHFRRQNEYDKAMAIYEQILQEDRTDAEAYWSLVLCRYGIEYVEDPASHKRMPTVNRVQYTSVLADEDYKSALQYADAGQRTVYEGEAKAIGEIQKGILEISKQEKPFDVFICYKETDANGRRTPDSVLANDLYHQLTNEGFKVFFSRITLEDKIGTAYEPYIFAALNSAKVMVVLGTKPEYFNAVWVKNEWSRYLALIRAGADKVLVPAYRDMDPYDLPDEFSHLQAQDMGKLGFMQDLIRGIKKITAKDEPKVQPTVQQVTAASANIENLMKRVRLFMEDGDFSNANEYLDKVLDENAEYAPAYAAKVCVTLKLSTEADLANTPFLYEDNADWQKALRFADAKRKEIYSGYIAQVRERVKKQIRDHAYDCAMEMATVPNADKQKLEAEQEAYVASCNHSYGSHPDGGRRKDAEKNDEAFLRTVCENDPGEVSEENYHAAAEMLRAIGDDQANECGESCLVLAEIARQKKIYIQAANKSLQSLDACEWDKLAEQFSMVPDYKDAMARAESCREKASTIRSDLYNAAKKAIQEAGNDKWKWEDVKNKLNTPELNDYRDVAVLRAQAAQRFEQCIEAEQEAQKQSKARQEGKAAKEAAKKKRTRIAIILLIVITVAAYFAATKYFIPKSHYDKGISLRNSQQWEKAIEELTAAGTFNDAKTQILVTYYAEGETKRKAQDWEGALTAFEQAGEHVDSDAIKETHYQHAAILYKMGKYEDAYTFYSVIPGYKDVDSIVKNDNNIAAVVARKKKLEPFKNVGSYVTFGTYPQTTNGTDNTTIEWLVLDYDAANNCSLLISRYGLDTKPYNENYEDITWEKCTLRDWLNSTFYNKAFSSSEQSAILLTDVDNSECQGYSAGDWNSKGGNNTQDKVFLLSYAEANKYWDIKRANANSSISDNAKIRIQPTAYTVEQGASVYSKFKTVDGTDATSWWLRSPGFRQNEAACVTPSGALYAYDVNDDNNTVRPVFWLDLNAVIF